jgi:uncharacterized coiled-coil protein SlyX
MPKPKDFSESAVNLVNPPEVGEKLKELHQAQEDVKLQEQLLSEIATYQLLKEAEQKVADITAQIKAMVDKLGSWQSLEDETYAVKYARKTAVYDNLPSFKKHFPKFVELCVKETLDVNALKGQIRGKLITEAELEKTKVLTYETGYAFYVR